MPQDGSGLPPPETLRAPRCLRKKVLEIDSMPHKKRYSNRHPPDRPAKGRQDAAFDGREEGDHA